MTDSDKESESTKLAGLRHQVALLAETLEKMRLAEYIAYLNRPGRLLWFNFLVCARIGNGVGSRDPRRICVFLIKTDSCS